MIKLGPYPTKAITLSLPWTGCWEALVAYEGKAIAGPVVIDWRGWQLSGEVDPQFAGLFAGEPAVRVVGGFAWCTRRDWRPFQSERPEGLTAREVALSLAEQLGQRLEVQLDRRLGRHFVPRRESGGALLTRLFGKHWHVEPDGSARAEVRPVPPLGAGVTVRNYDPRDGQATVYAERPDRVPVGATLPLDARLRVPRRVTKLVATAKGNQERLTCYTADAGIATNPAPLGPPIALVPSGILA